MSLSDQLQTLKENWLLVIGLVLLALFMTGGQTLSSVSQSGGPGYREDLARTADAGSSGGRQVQTTSSLSVSTTSIDEQVTRVSEIASGHNAVLLNENQDRVDGDLSSAHYEISVPAVNRSSLLQELRGLGTVTNYNVRSEDVTERYQDLQSELESEREKLSRLNQLYNDSTNELKAELLDKVIDQERRVRRLERQIEDVDDRVTKTTVYFTLERYRYVSTEFVSVQDVLNNAVRSVNSLISWTVYLLPWAVIASIGYWLYGRRKDD